MGLRQLVPEQARGWQAEATSHVYRPDTLFDYLDGGAELYLAYGFREMLACRFHKGGEPDIVVDVFDMGSSEDAFGVFSAERQDPEAGIGQGSEYAAGLLRFWKGRFFVSVWAERETPATRSSVLDLGAKIAEAIEPPGHAPRLLDLLPEDNLATIGVRYFHDHTSLNFHYFVAEDNILGLGEQSEAVLAPYRTVGGTIRLLLVRYPTAQEAQKALDGFLAAYLPRGGETGMAQIEGGRWVAAQSQADMVMVVFGASGRGQAEQMLKAVRERLEDRAL